MEKIHRREANLGGVFRQVGSDPSVSPGVTGGGIASPLAAAGWKARLRPALRAVARPVWRLVKPFARGPMHRLRNFMQEPQRQEIQAARDALRQDIINTQTWAYHETQALTATLAREMLAVREVVASEFSRVQVGLRQNLAEPIATPAAVVTTDPAVGDRFLRIDARLDDMLGRLDRIEAYALRSAMREAVPVGNGRVMVRSSVGYMVCEASDTALLAQLLERGELETGTRLLIQATLRPGMTFVDVGANIGMHTVAAGGALKGEGRIVAFEPFPSTAALLDENIWNNGLSEICEVHVAAIADGQDERSFFLGRTSGHHSLYPLDKTAVRGGGAREVRVKVDTLDEVLGAETHVDLIKIDAEGAELDVVRGAKGILATNPDIALIVELGSSHLARTGHDLAGWLGEFSALGFQWSAVDELTGELSAISMAELKRRESVNLFLTRHQAN